MSENLRREVTSKVTTLVVKVGTQILSDDAGKLDRKVVTGLARQVTELTDRGLKVILVSSGAVGAGMGELGLTERPQTLPGLQAAAAVGQSHLIRAYDVEFSRHGRRAAQVLLVRDDFHDRVRYLNVANTIGAILDFGAIPVINENDTTSVEELELSFTDNDMLAALVTNLLRAELLVMLTNVDGLLESKSGEVIDVVESMTDAVKGLAGATRSRGGTGGMTSKLRATEIATGAGEAVVIANGGRPNVLADILDGKKVGTLFLPTARKMSARKRWIGFSARAKGKLRLDAGAARALTERGKSLLPSGITAVEGDFGRGDIVVLTDSDGTEIGRGLANYDAHDTSRIVGHKTSQIASVLGTCPYIEVVHRDNMVIFET